MCDNIMMWILLIPLLQLSPLTSAQDAHGLFFPDESTNLIQNNPKRRISFDLNPARQEPEIENVLYYNQLNSMTNMHDFAVFLNISESDNEREVPSISSRFGGSEVVEELPQATCTPEEVTLHLDLPNESGYTYFPTCVRVPRCGGCCFIPVHSCQPVESVFVQVRVMKVNGNVANATPRRNRRVRREHQYEMISVEKHLKCNCECKLKESSCDLNVHTYSPNLCACVCKNKDQETKCLNSRDHYWNSDRCECVCRSTKICSTGRTFSHKTCTCV